MSGWPFPVGLCPLHVLPHAISEPRTTSWILAFSSWRLSGACCSPHRVVADASLQGLSGCLYTLWCFHIPSLRFHGAPWRFASRPQGRYGRNAGYPTSPVQTRTCSFPASGSSVTLASVQVVSVSRHLLFARARREVGSYCSGPTCPG